MGTSTFAEYTVMPEIALAKVSPDAPLEGCAPFACGLSTGIGAALYTAQVEPGSTCVVFGCGLVGLGAVIGARLAGAERIVAIDLSEERLAQARHHGATDTRVAGDDTVDWIRAETGGFGADYTFEATGNVAVMRQAVEAAREAWGLATMCGVAGKGETLDIVPRFLITGRRVTGSSFGGVKGRTQVPLLVDRWLAGEIDVEALVSHRLDARRRQPRLRADGAAGRDPQRDHVRRGDADAEGRRELPLQVAPARREDRWVPGPSLVPPLLQAALRAAGRCPRIPVAARGERGPSRPPDGAGRRGRAWQNGAGRPLWRRRARA